MIYQVVVFIFMLTLVVAYCAIAGIVMLVLGLFAMVLLAQLDEFIIKRITLKLLRWIYKIPAPKITRKEAIEIGDKEFGRPGSAVDNSFLMRNVRSQECLRTWRVRQRLDGKPTCSVFIDNQTGAIIEELDSSPRM